MPIRVLQRKIIALHHDGLVHQLLVPYEGDRGWLRGCALDPLLPFASRGVPQRGCLPIVN